MKRIGLLLLLFACAGLAQPLDRAHAHNDYLHPRPLLDALAHGFRSVEADIWLTNGALLVAHDLADAIPGRTLQALYLDPLRSFVRTNREAQPVTLLIDVKSAAMPTYAHLRNVLNAYAEMLTRFEAERTHTNAVIVVISGNRDFATMKAEPRRLAALDGRVPDLSSNHPPALVPLISEDWRKLFTWRGSGPMPEEERLKLRRFVVEAHAQGRRIRFWAVPDRPEAWRELHQAGVDLINTDKLADLEEFLRDRR